ncbi:hypothetical protein [Acidovorax sp. FG27]|uniref:hypothetical protein n=1 Tax=Acidovorax sp. FG27 TaxID=3133652 RepID=UPI0030EA5FD8
MHRFVLVFLLLVLPVQWTWAAAASICRHEAAATSQHFGHHDHRHDVGGADAAAPEEMADSGDRLPEANHADCASCHGAAPALTALHEAPARHQPLPQGTTPYLRTVTSGIPDRLIRPPHPGFL